MKVRLLPSNLIDPAHLQPLTTFLLNDAVAIDAGSLGFALALESQRLVREVIITHSHTDHIATLPVFIAEAFPFLEEPVYLYSTKETIDCLREHVFNDKIWPDFHRMALLSGNGTGLHYIPIEPLVTFKAADLRFTPVWMNHTVPTVGLIVEDGHSAVIFTSDTYHTEEIWELANRLKRLKAVFIDVSYPNGLKTLAEDSKHLTPRSLEIELRKFRRNAPVIAVHIKPQFHAQVVGQLRLLNIPRVAIGEIGREYVF